MKCRTTVTLDQELIQLVREEAVATHRRFAEVLNDRLRRGFTAKERLPRTKRFTVKPLPAGGFAPGVDENKLNQLFDAIESETNRK